MFLKTIFTTTLIPVEVYGKMYRFLALRVKYRDCWNVKIPIHDNFS